MGVGVRTVPRRGTGPLPHKRIAERKAALRKTRTIQEGFDKKTAVVAVMIVAATLFGVELADVAPRDVNSLELAIMTAIWGPSRPCRAQSGSIHGGSVQEDVLACTHCTHPGHCPNRHTSHVGASRETQRYEPAGSRPARIPMARLAHFAGVVELGNAANWDLGALCTRIQGVCRALVSRFPERSPPGGARETDTEALWRHGNSARQRGHTE